MSHRHFHPKKEYCRIAKNYHEQFPNFKLCKGAIYGRLWSENQNEYMYFVSNYREVIRGDKIRVWIKEGDRDWKLEKICLNSRINSMIQDCIEKNGAPVLGSYNAPRKNPKKSVEQIIEFNGKKYTALPYEMYMQNIYIPEEYDGVLPVARRPKPFDAKRMKPDFTQYTIEFCGRVMLFYEYEEAEKYCEKMGISKDEIKQDFIYDDGSVIYDDRSYQVTGKNKMRISYYDRKKRMDV